MNDRVYAGSKAIKWLSLGLVLALVTGLLSACTRGPGTSEPENRVLRIGVLYSSFDNEPYFRQQYTDMFEMQNPNIQFEIVGAINYDDQRFTPREEGETYEEPDPFEKMKEMMTGNNPVDVVVLDYNMLRRMTQDNLLQPLDPLVERDKFDISDYVPTVIDGIKSAGDNNLYALTPTFNSSALFYNKKLFADLNVEPPTDKMEWSDVLNKARQVADGEGIDRTFGFSFNRWTSDGYNDAQNYARTLQLRMWDEKGEKMTVNSPQWIEVWEYAKALYHEKLTPDYDYVNMMYEQMSESGGYDPFYGDLFIQGKLAMVIGEYYYINELRRVADNAASIDGFEMVDWDVVTVPVHSSNPGVGGNIYLSQLMGINAKAQNPEDAWKFIQFSNGKEWAKLKARSTSELVARKSFIQIPAGMNYNIDAFTLLKPLPPQSINDDKLYREKPGIWEVQYIASSLFQEVMDGTKDVSEALAEWETRGNAILEGQTEMGEDMLTSMGRSGPAAVEAVAIEDVSAAEEWTDSEEPAPATEEAVDSVE